MTIAEDRIDPQPESGVFPSCHAGAGEAFDAGNYAEAFLSADVGSKLRAMAAIMCGAVATGLQWLGTPGDNRALLAAAYGRWCLGEGDAALALLMSVEGENLVDPARGLAELIETPEIPIAVLTMPGASKAAGFASADGFAVTLLSVEPGEFGITWSELWAKKGGGENPQLVLAIDAFGPYLPVGVEIEVPSFVLWSSDMDYFLATRGPDYAAAHVIVVNTASECASISDRFGGRVASFPGHDSYAPITGPVRTAPRSVDLYFTGRAFTSYMRGKSQFLFALASLDEADLQIEFLNDYLSEEAYDRGLSGARFVPTYLRFTGGIQTRSADAISAGAQVITNEAPGFSDLLSPGPAPFLPVSGKWKEGASGLGPSGADALFWRSPAREERFLKFCLLQGLLADRRPEQAPPAAVPVELRGYEKVHGLRVYTRIANLNAASPETPANYNYAAAAAFYAAILAPEKTEFTDLALQFYDAGMDAFPDHLMLRFNGALVQWCAGHKNQASANLMTVIEQGSSLDFDATRDAILSHRVRVLSDLVPYGDYYGVAAGYLGDAYPGSILKCAAMTFLASDAFDEGRLDEALDLLDAASKLFGRSAPVWRLTARAHQAAGSDPSLVRKAFYRAVNLYPGELPGLLKIGVEAELAQGREAEATDILRKWTTVAARVKTGDGGGYGITSETLAVAEAHKALLSGWTRDLLDSILGGGEGR